MKKTTKAQFAEFQRWVNHYVQQWHLGDWTIHFHHGAKESDPEDISAMIRIRKPLLSRTVDVIFTDNYESIEGIDLRKIAKHEAAHLLTGRLFCLGELRETTWDELVEEWEAVTCKIENLFPD